jgi:hypothetical protein
MDDGQLVAGLALTMIFFVAGLATRWWIFGALSFSPVLYILFLYYIKRKDFLSLRAT